MMDRVLQEQIAYYRARAPEYDEWLLRQGRYDQGPVVNAGWRTELEEVIQGLEGFALRGRVLELAGGSGIWTKHLAQAAAELTVVDASPEMLAINRDRVRDPYVRYITADLFEWHPETVYDVVFFGFWLSHVPPEWFVPFWSLVARCLAPGGRAVFIDNVFPSTTAGDHQPMPNELTTTRELNDGRRFQIYKRFYRPEELTQYIHALGWRCRVHATSTYFLYGWANTAPPPNPTF
jgi:demethylmenaquinone methyltransferase/2-methoxy-6-polyprenyl-1,4-benzoquinol methylase